VVQKRKLNNLSLGKNTNFDRKQRSRFKRFVATFDDGKIIQASSQKELIELISKKDQELAEEIKEVLAEIKEDNKPKFDPMTGEPI